MRLMLVLGETISALESRKNRKARKFDFSCEINFFHHLHEMCSGLRGIDLDSLVDENAFLSKCSKKRSFFRDAFDASARGNDLRTRIWKKSKISKFRFFVGNWIFSPFSWNVLWCAGNRSRLSPVDKNAFLRTCLVKRFLFRDAFDASARGNDLRTRISTISKISKFHIFVWNPIFIFNGKMPVPFRVWPSIFTLTKFSKMCIFKKNFGAARGIKKWVYLGQERRKKIYIFLNLWKATGIFKK